MNRSVASTGWCPSQPPRTTRQVRSVVIGCSPGWCSRGRCSSSCCLGGAGLDGGEDALDVQRLLEGGRGVGALADRRDEVGDLVGEGVLVAQSVTGGPPVRRVGVLGLGGEDAGEALAARGGGGVVDLQLVHALEEI